MSSKTKTHGAFGEDYTVKYLKKHGYKVVERNYHSRFGEIDIIAIKKTVIALVEVKTRTEGSLYSPREAVNYFKQQKCVKTAQIYLMENHTELQPRFDVSEIVIKKGLNERTEVKLHNYIENAFSLG